MYLKQYPETEPSVCNLKLLLTWKGPLNLSKVGQSTPLLSKKLYNRPVKLCRGLTRLFFTFFRQQTGNSAAKKKYMMVWC